MESIVAGEAVKGGRRSARRGTIHDTGIAQQPPGERLPIRVFPSGVVKVVTS